MSLFLLVEFPFTTRNLSFFFFVGMREKVNVLSGAWSLSTDFLRWLLKEYVANEIIVFNSIFENQLSYNLIIRICHRNV